LSQKIGIKKKVINRKQNGKRRGKRGCAKYLQRGDQMDKISNMNNREKERGREKEANVVTSTTTPRRRGTEKIGTNLRRPRPSTCMKKKRETYLPLQPGKESKGKTKERILHRTPFAEQEGKEREKKKEEMSARERKAQ